jgi:membrane fusion protein, heavy metal efflux system
MKIIKNQFGKISQQLVIIVVLFVTAVLVLSLIIFNKSKDSDHLEEDDHAVEGEKEGDHEDENSIVLTSQQMVEQGIQIAKVDTGVIDQLTSYPAKLTANTDRQAHVSPSFSGQVQAVHVELGQEVKKGQALASLLVPELVDQQAQLQIDRTNLELAKQDFEREKDLWSQGISAKQDYQRASNAYRQAQIQVQASQSRLSAFGASSGLNGRYVMTAPISGVISQKDLVVGENVQLASQLFVIDQLDQLWLEFIVPNIDIAKIQPNQTIQFKSLQTNKLYKAQIMNLNSTADAQTGRLQVRAKVLDLADELRPNLMVNVELQQNQPKTVTRVSKEAIQQVDGKNVVFIPTIQGKKASFKPQDVSIGQVSADGKWIELADGLKQGQSYVSKGSFLLKSEMEKGEASHGH